jgi:uncharacterized membrane protein
VDWWDFSCTPSPDSWAFIDCGLNAMRYLTGYAATFIVLLALDLMWLRYASDTVFRPNVGEMLTNKPNLAAAGLSYVFFTAGLVFLAVSPAMKNTGMSTALRDGAVLGFMAHTSFDLTNLAILRVWSVKVSLIDISWGTFVSGMSAMAGCTAMSFKG